MHLRKCSIMISAFSPHGTSYFGYPCNPAIEGTIWLIHEKHKRSYMELRKKLYGSQFYL